MRKSIFVVIAALLFCVGCASVQEGKGEELMPKENESQTITLFDEKRGLENESDETVTVIYEDTVLPSDAPDAKVNGLEVESTVSSVPKDLPDNPDAAWDKQNAQ